MAAAARGDMKALYATPTSSSSRADRGTTPQEAAELFESQNAHAGGNLDIFITQAERGARDRGSHHGLAASKKWRRFRGRRDREGLARAMVGREVTSRRQESAQPVIRFEVADISVRDDRAWRLCAA